MTAEELLNLFDTFATSVFRLETLQHYTVRGDEARQQAFHEGRPLPPPTKGMQETIRWIRDSVKAGKRIYRVHVLDVPLTPYCRYELAMYRENTEPGEEVFIADRRAHPDLGRLRDDFVLFDAETDRPTVVWFRYDAQGCLQRYERTDDPAVIQECCRRRDLALAHAISLDNFTASRVISL